MEEAGNTGLETQSRQEAISSRTPKAKRAAFHPGFKIQIILSQPPNLITADSTQPGIGRRGSNRAPRPRVGPVEGIIGEDEGGIYG